MSLQLVYIMYTLYFNQCQSSKWDTPQKNEEIIQLHREGRMSPGEQANTIIKTVGPLDQPFSSLEDSCTEDQKTN